MDVTGIFCGKLFQCPVNDPTRRRSSTEDRINTGFSALSTVKRRRRMPELRRWRGAEIPEAPSHEGPAKTKDPSGGTTGRVKLYGRLGWMGARAEYSLDGEGLSAPTNIGRSRLARRSNLRRSFLTFLAEIFGQKITARRGDRVHRKTACLRPWRPPAGSVPASGEPVAHLKLFRSQARRKPRQPATPARCRPR